MVMKMWIVSLVCFGNICLAAEPAVLPLELGTFKTLDNKVYDETKVVGCDAVGIKIMHAGGTARITYDRLTPDLAARFKVDRSGAEEQLRKEAAESAAHEREMQLALKEEKRPGAKTEKSDPVAAGEEEEDIWDIEVLPTEGARSPKEERVRVIEAYIERLIKEIEGREKEIRERNMREALEHQRRAKYGNPSSNRTAYIAKARAKEREKIIEAQQRIDSARRELSRLK